MAGPVSDSKPKFKLNTGLDWVSAKGPQRAEAGDVRDDIPKTSQDWLLAQKLIEPYVEPKAKAKDKA